APNVSLTNSLIFGSGYPYIFRITGGGTLYMIAPANNYYSFYTVSQGRVRVDDLSVTNNGSVLGSKVTPEEFTLDGGALQYTGPTVATAFAFTVSPAGGAVEVSNAATTLTLTGPIVSSGPLN